MLSRQAKYALNRLLARTGYRIQRVDPTSGAGMPGEDMLLELVFEQLIERIHQRIHPSEFFFIQVGAYDGLTNDPLHARVRHYRWRGVLLEPQTGPFRALQENYRGQDQLIFLNAAVSDRDGQAPLYVVPQEEGQPAWSQQIASFRPEVVLRHDDAGLAVPVPRGIRNLADKMEPQLVDTMTFGSLLERFDIKRIDLLQIDAEGYDGELLRLFDFDRLQPSMIRYEHMHLSKKEQGACLDLLLDLGYLFTVGVSDTLAYRS